MTTHHLPKGVSLDTLEDIIAGWDAVDAAAEPRYTSAVEDETGITDAVGRQTRFLEEVGVLEAEGQKQRLTERGQDLASALAADDEERAKGRARELLSEWPVTDEIRGILRGNPTDEETLVSLVSDVTGQDLDASRVRSGITTLLDFYEWADILERDEKGRYHLPDDEPPTGDEEEDDEPALEEDNEVTLEELVEAADVSDVEALLAEVTSATEEAREAAEEAREAAQEAGGSSTDGDESMSVTAGPASADSSVDTDHALSLAVNLDADPEDLEPLVRALRRGLIDDGEDGNGDSG